MLVGFDIKKKMIVKILNTLGKYVSKPDIRLSFSTDRSRATRITSHGYSRTYWSSKIWWVKILLTVLEDLTHCLQKYKSEAQYYIKEYITELKGYKNMRLSKIRCYNGGEFANRIKIWCKKKGIVINVTEPYSPQLNGKAEHIL